MKRVALLGVLLVATSAAQALAVSALLRTAPALAALQDEGDEEATDQEQADEAESADEAQSEDGADVAEAVSDEEEPAEVEESVDESEPAGESEPADATEPAAAATEEPVASAPATGQPAADVERWSVTINSPMGVINQELAIEKSSGAAVVARIWGDGVNGQRVPLEIAGDKRSWSWDVTNPMPMQITCESTTQGERMTGNCKLGMYGHAAMFGSRK